MQIQAAIVLVIVFCLLLAYGTPVSFSIISAALVTIIMFLSPNFGMFISAQKLVGGIDSFSLLAVPFFILAGLLMSSGGGENHLGSCSQPVLNRNHYRRHPVRLLYAYGGFRRGGGLRLYPVRIHLPQH